MDANPTAQAHYNSAGAASKVQALRQTNQVQDTPRKAGY